MGRVKCVVKNTFLEAHVEEVGPGDADGSWCEKTFTRGRRAFSDNVCAGLTEKMEEAIQAAGVPLSHAPTTTHLTPGKQAAPKSPSPMLHPAQAPPAEETMTTTWPGFDGQQLLLPMGGDCMNNFQFGKDMMSMLQLPMQGEGHEGMAPYPMMGGPIGFDQNFVYLQGWCLHMPMQQAQSQVPCQGQSGGENAGMFNGEVTDAQGHGGPGGDNPVVTADTGKQEQSSLVYQEQEEEVPSTEDMGGQDSSKVDSGSEQQMSPQAPTYPPEAHANYFDENGVPLFTTVMLRNVPNKYTREMFVKELDVHFRGQFDFVYLPIDFKNGCNIGYGFVNFNTREACGRFWQEFNGAEVKKCLPGFHSRKVAEVRRARVQGLEENVERLRNSPVMGELINNPEWMPLLLDGNGQELPFPMPEQPIPPVRARGRKNRDHHSEGSSGGGSNDGWYR